MNLNKLFELQAKLDDRIVKEKGLYGEDLLPKKILALQVELGELAQNWRGFKFWSGRQEPVTENLRVADYKESGEAILETYNPLLEEYVDCLHFILSIGNDIEITEEEIFNYGGRKKEINKTFVDLFVGTGVLLYRNQPIKTNYVTVFNDLLNLGKMLGFTWEQIETAYYEKNKINHERQANGY